MRLMMQKRGTNPGVERAEGGGENTRATAHGNGNWGLVVVEGTYYHYMYAAVHYGVDF